MNVQRLTMIVLLVALGISGYFNFSKNSAIFRKEPQQNLRDTNLQSFIENSGKLISQNEFGYARADGVWVAADNTAENRFLKDQINSVRIECHKDQMKCFETEAVLFRLRKEDKYQLDSYEFEYDVEEWNANFLKAKMITPGQIWEVTINSSNQTALLSMQDNPENPTATAYVSTATLENKNKGLEQN